MFDVTASTAALLPAARPRYFMGIGDPEGILRVIGAGVDMFDCVLPTRLGRTGSATTWEGRLNLRNARFARDDGPLAGGLRVPRLHALLARLHPPPDHAGRAARAAAPDAPQPLVPDRALPRGAARDRRGPLPGVRRRGARAARLGDGAEGARRGAGRAVKDAAITLAWIAGLVAADVVPVHPPAARAMARQRRGARRALERRPGRDRRRHLRHDRRARRRRGAARGRARRRRARRPPGGRRRVGVPPPRPPRSPEPTSGVSGVAPRPHGPRRPDRLVWGVA